jgi:hypothetical protein
MEENRELALSALLADAFDGDPVGLQRWIRLEFGKQIHRELPSVLSLADLAFQAMLAFQRNGLMDRALFEGLRALRPGLDTRIREVARLWGIELADAGLSSSASAAHDSVLDLHAHLPHFNRLESLLARLFTPQEAHEWLTRIMGPETQDSLSPSILASSALIREDILALHRRGLLDAEFFRALAAERPGRIADIKLTECWWLGRPKHFRLSPYMSIRGEDLECDYANVPDCCISIQLSSMVTWDPLLISYNDIGPDELLFESDGVVFDMDAYPELPILLEDLYVNYLRSSFPPLTYGTTWILNGSQAVVPWEWLVEHHISGYELPMEWLMSVNYTDFGIAQERPFEVIDLRQHEPNWGVGGIATNSSDLYTLLSSGTKLAWRFMDSDLVADVSPASIGPSDFRYRSVHVRSSWSLGRLPRLGAFVQTRPLNPEEQEHISFINHRILRRK